MTAQYEQVRGSFARREVLPLISAPILLKNGETLLDVSPYGFKTKKTNIAAGSTLELMYLDKYKKAGRVDVEQINGLNIVVENGILYILTTYYRPKDNMLEPSQRKLRVKSVKYGIQENHQKVGEKPDFYIVADDMQYVEKQQPAERNFPFWRLGIYGRADEVKNVFQPSS